MTKGRILPDGWKEVRLGDVMEITSCKRVHESDWTNSGIPFYRAREIVALHNKEKINPLYISEELYNKRISVSGKIQKNDLLVTGVGTIGIQYLVKDNDNFYFKDGNIIWFKNKNSIHGSFLYYSFDGSFIKKQIKNSAGIGTVGTYTIASAKKTKIFLPPLKEQEKIAEILTSWDDAIELTTSKIEQLKLQKKSLMQKLLSPKPHWEERRLSDVCDIITGSTPKTENKAFYGDEYLFVSPTDIGNLKYISKTKIMLSKKGFDISRLIKKGSSMFVCIGSTIGKVGVAAQNCISNQQINSCYSIDNSNDFIYYQLLKKSKKIKLLAGKQAVPILNKTQFSKVKIDLPPTLSEQKQIAEILTTQDDLISLNEKKLANLKLQKKALMQKLLTGEWRV